MSSLKRPMRPRKSEFALKTFPCQAQRLQQLISELSVGSGNPHDENFSTCGYLRDSLLSRYADPSKEGAVLRKRLAVDKLLAAEEKNKITNQRFADYGGNSPTIFVQAVLDRSRLIIAEILGELDYSIFLKGGFSNGSTTSRLRASGTAASKFDGKGDVTLNAYPYISTLVSLTPIWEEAHWQEYKRTGKQTLRLVEGNVVFTVPKDNVIDRAAAKEPDYNMYLQRAVGGHVRRRLKTFGIDLNDQTVNQRLAQDGSRTGDLATLDLSAASDSITTGLIQHLFPQEWCDLLFALRSERGIFPDAKPNEFHTWEMLSSMGNGFTFEVETLVFYSLCRAVAYVRGQRGTISVYGDDIIAPVSIVSGIRRIFRYCGFTLNTSKSFYTTPFRESCGKHYYDGEDVTPFYIRHPITDVIRAMHFANRLREWSNVGGICDPRYFPIWEAVARMIPMKLGGGVNTAEILSLVSPPTKENGFRLLPVKQRVSNHHKLSHYIASLASGPSSVELIQPDYETKRLIENVLSTSSKEKSTYKYHRNSTTGGIPLFPQEIPGPVDSSL